MPLSPGIDATVEFLGQLRENTRLSLNELAKEWEEKLKRGGIVKENCNVSCSINPLDATMEIWFTDLDLEDPSRPKKGVQMSLPMLPHKVELFHTLHYDCDSYAEAAHDAVNNGYPIYDCSNSNTLRLGFVSHRCNGSIHHEIRMGTIKAQIRKVKNITMLEKNRLINKLSALFEPD